MEPILRISSLMSEPWISWVMFALLVLLALNRFFIIDIEVVFRTLFSRSERLYLDSTWQRTMVAWLYQSCALAMVVYLWVTKQQNTFAPIDYAICIGGTGGVILMQMGLLRFVGEVFLSARQRDYVFELRNCICNAFSVLLWPCALLLQWVGSLAVTKAICYIMVGLFVLLLLVRCVQLFYKGLLSILYVLLYIIGLEVVPLMAAVSIVKNILE